MSNGSGKVAVSDVTSTELEYLSGVNGAIQTQLDGKQATISNDLTIFDNSNNADVSLSLGTSASEAFIITVLNGTSNKTCESVTFTTKTASSTADHGKFTFSVDETDILDIDDGGINIASGKDLQINGSSVLNNTSLGSGVTGSSLTSVGTISTGVWNGTAIAGSYIFLVLLLGMQRNRQLFLVVLLLLFQMI